MLSAELQRIQTPDSLMQQYVNMIHYASELKHEGHMKTFVMPCEGEYSLQITNTIEDYRNKKPNDIGWAYCSISGDSYSEAVSVVVERDDYGHLVIGEVEWGRP